MILIGNPLIYRMILCWKENLPTQMINLKIKMLFQPWNLLIITWLRQDHCLVVSDGIEKNSRSQKAMKVNVYIYSLTAFIETVQCTLIISTLVIIIAVSYTH